MPDTVSNLTPGLLPGLSHQADRDNAPKFSWSLVIQAILFPLLLLVAIVAVSQALAYLSVNMPAGLLAADSWLFRWLTSLRTPQVTPVIFILVNDPGLDYSLPIALCLAFVWWRRRQDMVGAAAALGLTMIVGAWSMPHTQAFGFRPRPFMVMTDVPIDPYWHSVWKEIPTFPSGHVREMTGLCVVLAYYWRKVRWWAIAAALFVAVSRVYLGAHYPTDVLAGVVVGSLSAVFALVTVSLARRLLLAAYSIPKVERAVAYFMRPASLEHLVGGWMINGIARVVMGLVLVVVACTAIGYLIYIKEPRILADYLRNTDNSLVGPIFGLLAPGAGQVVYWIFGDWRTSYTVMIAIIVWRTYRQRETLSRLAIALMVAFAVIWLLAVLLGPSFVRARPLGKEGLILPEGWVALWPGPLHFPDVYLAGLVAIAGILARAWPAAKAAAYGFAIAAAIALLYCGAMWPMDALGNLFVGYWSAIFGRFGANLLPPWPGWSRAR